jgi:hypothetical protein
MVTCFFPATTSSAEGNWGLVGMSATDQSAKRSQQTTEARGSEAKNSMPALIHFREGYEGEVRMRRMPA